jgi:hypothetical protein
LSIDGTYRLAREDDLSAMRLIQSTALLDLVVTRGGRESSVMPKNNYSNTPGSKVPTKMAGTSSPDRPPMSISAPTCAPRPEQGPPDEISESSPQRRLC